MNTNNATDTLHETSLEVLGARVHNLKNIDVTIPRDQLVVITGVSGSGKSSLAFDTIYAEGQRRYLESFSAYARQFIGDLERPDVDKIMGLSPVISIEQKTVSKNPRSTVGTVTEVYDFMRLLYARVAEAYSYKTGEKMVQYSQEQILNHILEKFDGKKLVLLAPVVKGRKGHYRELFEKIRKQGFLKAYIDGEMVELEPDMKLDRYKIHDIEVVVDKVIAKSEARQRLTESLELALDIGNDSITIKEFESAEMHHFSKRLMCPTSGISYDEPAPNSFSFNSPYGACPNCDGLGTVYEVDKDAVIPDDEVSIADGGIAPLGRKENNMTFRQIKALTKKFDFDLETPVKDIPEEAMDIILNGTAKEGIEVYIDYGSDYGVYHDVTFEGIYNMIERHESSSSSKKIRRWARRFMKVVDCPECGGGRLKKESLHFKIDGKNIAELAEMELAELLDWLQDIEERLSEKQRKIAEDVLKEIRDRLRFLMEVGLDYLSLTLPAKSLSGGESQRIRLATQIGSRLSGVLYILDEPTVGLHQRDNQRLIRALRKLVELGNTVFVVEHDRSLMDAADYILDLGPGAGVEGGRVVGEGPADDFMKQGTLTAEYLRGEKQVPLPKQRREGNDKSLKLYGARGHNLKNVEVEFPLGTLMCVTGVSGSGKSSLVNETLYPVLHKHFYTRSVQTPLDYDGIEGLENIDKVIEIDQSPIGRTPRSTPATYIGVFDHIRDLFARLPESEIRGYKPGRFSFNVKEGRCNECKGNGVKVIEMRFLPDVSVPCKECFGKRYDRETLEIRYKGKSISDVLDMTVDEAVEFFESIPNIYRKMKTLQDVGLGYIRLGQPSTTLSGGEAQRVKLSSELAKKATGNTVYILDEPTTGLHFDDIRVLMNVLSELVDKGNTVIIIEHNMDVIKQADHIIDLGPEGGRNGGKVIATGSPEALIENKDSYTGQFLKEELRVKTS